MATISGSIDTSQVDTYRCGVELTLPSHFTVGVAKIWSGYDYHMPPQNVFGQSLTYDQETPFEERMKFDPVVYIQHSSERANFDNLSTAYAARLLDGAMEPLEIRSGSLDGFPQLLHSVKGLLLDGNSNEFGETDRIKNEYVPLTMGTLGPFVDARADKIRRETYKSGTLPKEALELPFADDFPESPGLIIGSNFSPAMRSAVGALTPENVVATLSNKHKSMTCGFTYDFVPLGTDSIAFGGLK